ncbi:MAG: hypothetical protein ABJA67_05520 [Chthonomonadales bacterium]
MSLRATLVALVLLVIGILPCAGQAGRTGGNKVLIILIVPGLTEADIRSDRLPELKKLAAESAVGWMNTRTARVPGQTREPEESAYLTLGAGSRGTAPPSSQTDTLLNWSSIQKFNAHLDHPVEIGALSKWLVEHGVSISLSGNEDTDTLQLASRLFLDSPLSRTTFKLDQFQSAEEFAFGIKNQFTFERPESEHAVVAFVFGDLKRADAYETLALPGVARPFRDKARNELNSLLIQIKSQFPADDLLLLSPSAAASADPLDRLAPILLRSTTLKPGFIGSSSTHIPGLITNTDIAPGICNLLNIPINPTWIGSGLRSMPIEYGLMGSVDAMRSFLDISDGRTSADFEPWPYLHHVWLNSAKSQSIMNGFPGIQAAIVLCVTLMLISRWTNPKLAKGWTTSVVVAVASLVASLPCYLFLLFDHGTDVPMQWAIALIGVALTLQFVLCSVFTRRTVTIVAATSGLLLALVVLAEILQWKLMPFAWMSYNLMEGARYYGIGNEYAGALFGCSAALMLIRPKLPFGTKRWTPFVPAILISLIIGMPQYGANAGAMLGCVLGLIAGVLVERKAKLNAKSLGLIALALVAAATIMILADAMRPTGNQSHIIRAASHGTSIPNIIIRKATLNLYLLFHSPWSLSLVASFFGLMVLIRKSGGIALEDRTAWFTAIFGAFGLFIFNDSGVVAAATMLLVWWGACVCYMASISVDTIAADVPAT